MRTGEGEARNERTTIRAVVFPQPNLDAFTIRVTRYDGDINDLKCRYLAWAEPGDVPLFIWREYEAFAILPPDANLTFDGNPMTAGKEVLKALGRAIQSSGIMDEP